MGRHDNGEGDVEIFVLSPASNPEARMTQAHALKLDIPGQLEIYERTRTWGFRYVVVIQCLDTAVLNWMANIFRYLCLYSRTLKNLHNFVILILTKLLRLINFLVST